MHKSPPCTSTCVLKSTGVLKKWHQNSWENRMLSLFTKKLRVQATLMRTWFQAQIPLPPWNRPQAQIPGNKPRSLRNSPKLDSETPKQAMEPQKSSPKSSQNTQKTGKICRISSKICQILMSWEQSETCNLKMTLRLKHAFVWTECMNEISTNYSGSLENLIH